MATTSSPIRTPCHGNRTAVGCANVTRRHAPSTGRTAAPQPTPLRIVPTLPDTARSRSMGPEAGTFSSPAKFNRGIIPD